MHLLEQALKNCDSVGEESKDAKKHNEQFIKSLAFMFGQKKSEYSGTKDKD